MGKIKDPGFGIKTERGASQIINKDGSSNVIHTNRQFRIDDLYSYLIQISWTMFFGYVILGYILINIFFGLAYNIIGIEEITPTTGNMFYDFLNAFFFSAQTLTTVGYGSFSPNGVLTGMVSTIEALVGLLCFSFITGLLYGRFSKPKASIEFSENLIIRDYKEGAALMFRLMNTRTTVMIEPEIVVTMSIANNKNESKIERSFFQLNLERSKIMYLPTMWTIVHIIDDTSPLIGYTKDELIHLDAELYILVKYFEDSFSQQLYQLFSYSFKELEMDKKFTLSYEFDENGNTILNHNNLNKLEDFSINNLI